MEWKNERIKTEWKLNKEKLVFLFCSGLILFILAMPGDRKDSRGSGGLPDDAPVFSSDTIGSTGTPDSRIYSSYEVEVENRVREILEGVEGVGELDVMVATTAKSSGYIPGEEMRPELTGIIISADGGGNAVIKAEITGAMEALFGLPTHKIRVMKRESGSRQPEL